MMVQKIEKQFFLGGIGGTGMAPLAIFLSQMGHDVCGFDDFMDPQVRFLLQWHGVDVVDRPQEAPKCDAFIHSHALGIDDPLVRKFFHKNIPV
ncbi:MAG: Mur ligase domain-containing protein, partial [Puniceicoccales bacterium]|nr:Mur ligase domain-containing protein [Puniceicoccales bacterium]